jgi:cellobiose phosphorylase
MASPQVSPNPYGYYDSDSREYVITRPDTPTPWINYLGEGRYGGIISNTAGGYSFDRDPRNRRVTRYRYNSVPLDQPGRYVYIRDQASGEYHSPTCQPVVGRQLESYECRHGTAYTRISSSYQGIATSILYFVPPGQSDCPVELWRVEVKNLSDRRRVLRLFSYAEFSFPDAVTDQQNLDWAQQIVFSKVTDGVVSAQTQFRPTTTFFASSQPPVGFDTDREEFVGRLRDLENPIVVESGEPRSSLAPRGNNVGVLCHEIALDPGEQTTLVYMLGITDKPELIASTVARFASLPEVERSFVALKEDWADYLGRFVVDTPDSEMNAMLNVWNPIQCRANLYWSRFVSGYDTGLGRGMGTRDSAQDTLGTVHNQPDLVRSCLSTLWKLQFADGHTWHQVFPLTGEGGPGLAGESPHKPQWFSDDHLWMVIGTCAYLKETADFAYLDEMLPFQDGGEGSVWEHVLRAVKFTLENRGPHGLPRIGFSDWDDTMNVDHGSGKAESVWTAEQFCRTMLDLAELCDHLSARGQSDKQGDAARFRQLHAEMASIVQQHGWAGDWYLRAYDDEGLPIGIPGEQYHQINMNPQTWSVIGELGDVHRQMQAMRSAHDRLNTPVGMRLMDPPYDRSLARIGGTTTFPPGVKENGGIFCHANTWLIVAAAMLGWNERAYEYYRQILPLARKDADGLMSEPYVYCQNIASPGHRHYGRGRNSWLTGTAAWTYVAGTQWVLGIRASYDGLRIAPMIPESWSGFTACRVFRGVTHEISVERTGKGNTVRLSVDGKELDGDVVPLGLVSGKERVTVRVAIG